MANVNDRPAAKRPERQIYRPPGRRNVDPDGSSTRTVSGSSRHHRRQYSPEATKAPENLVDRVKQCSVSRTNFAKPTQEFRAPLSVEPRKSTNRQPYKFYNSSVTQKDKTESQKQRRSTQPPTTTTFVVKVRTDDQEKPHTKNALVVEELVKPSTVVENPKSDRVTKIDLDTSKSKDTPQQINSKFSDLTSSSIDSNEKPKKLPNPSGGILRLNNESMKLLNQELKKDEEKSNTSKPMKIDVYAIHGLVEKLNNAIRFATSKQTLDHKESLLNSLRTRMLSMLEQMLMHDLKSAIEHNAMKTIWQSGFYPFIQYYRQLCMGTPPSADDQMGGLLTKRYTERYWSLLNEGIEYFESLKNKLYVHHHFSYGILLERRKHYDLNRALFSQLQDGIHVIKYIFIYLGDLARYRDSNRSNYEVTKGYYLKAHMLVPMNTHVCTQIAMISFYQKNYFDSAYYYIRSFDLEQSNNAENCFPTRHNMTIIFDEIQNNFQENFKLIQFEFDKIQKESQRKQQLMDEKTAHINASFRIEYWIRPDNSISKWDMYNFFDLAVLMSKEERNDLLFVYQHHIVNQFSLKELKSRFLVSFLMVHGLLNCRNGLDRYFDVANQMLIEFDALLNYCKVHNDESQGSVLSSLLLVKLFCVNIYTISNTMTKEDEQKNSAEYCFTHKNAYFIMSAMVSMVLRRLIDEKDNFYTWHQQMMAPSINQEERRMRTMSHLSTDSSDQLLDSFLDEPTDKNSKSNPVSLGFFTILPCIKIWSDWVITFKPRFPPQDTNDLRVDFQQNQWHYFAQLLTVLNRIKTFPVKFYFDDSTNNLQLSTPKSDNYELVQLPEDRCLEGYSPLAKAPESAKYTKLPFIPEIAYTYMRIASLQLFGDYLCGLENPYLGYNLRNSEFKSLIEPDDVEGVPGLKLKHLEEKKLARAIEQYKLLLTKNKKGYDDVEKDNKISLSEPDEYTDDEVITQIRKLDVGPVERRKLINYRLFRQFDPDNARYFKLLEHEDQKKIRIVIKPRYVVFDTNCLLSDLEQIKTMIQTAPFTVVIPLIVISELDYIITREQRSQVSESSISDLLKYVDNPSMTDQKNCIKEITQKANLALTYIGEVIGKSGFHLKAITSKGSLMDSISFQEELYDPRSHTNDDLVLYACANLVKNQPQTREMLKEQLEKVGEHVGIDDEIIFRDVIMVTDDRNLRLKSLGYDIPAKKLEHFVKWTIPSMQTRT